MVPQSGFIFAVDCFLALVMERVDGRDYAAKCYSSVQKG